MMNSGLGVVHSLSISMGFRTQWPTFPAAFCALLFTGTHCDIRGCTDGVLGGALA